MKTYGAIKAAQKCIRICQGICPGDSGDVKCFFCSKCVLSLDERISNLKAVQAVL